MTTQKCYSENERLQFQTLILKKLGDAETKLKAIEKTLRFTNENIAQDKIESIDDSFMVAELENLDFVKRRIQKYVKDLKNALIRVKRTDYGICRKTGKLISKERLALVPHTTLSVYGKSIRRPGEK